MSDMFDRTDSRKPRWHVQADFPKLSATDRADKQHWFQVLDMLEDALKRGATEVRIRPVKP